MTEAAQAAVAEVPLTCGGTLVKGEAEEQLLGKCSCYQDRQGAPELMAKAQAAGHPMLGQCCRYPIRVPRYPGDSCGEHSDRRARQLRTLAIWIAEELADGNLP